MNGVWKGWFPNGKLNYQGSYTMGHRSGHWTYYFSNGKKRDEGDFKVISRSKSLEKNSPNASSYQESVRHGKWASFDERGEKTAEGSYYEGEMDGRWLFYQPGEIMLAQEINYKKGVLDGVSISYDKKGKKTSEINYKDGAPHGEYKTWDSKGNLSKHLIYKNGKVVKDKLPKK